MSEPTPLTGDEAMSELRRVLMSEELFQQLGADRVEWGEPDAEGFYTPTVYAPSLGGEALLPCELAQAIQVLHDTHYRQCTHGDWSEDCPVFVAWSKRYPARHALTRAITKENP